MSENIFCDDHYFVIRNVDESRGILPLCHRIVLIYNQRFSMFKTQQEFEVGDTHRQLSVI